MTLAMTLIDKAGANPFTVTVADLVIAGWSGRDPDAMEHHIRELEALGVPRPKETPTFYRVSAARLTTAPTIQCLGGDSSGEAETVLFAQAGRLFVGLGSDHTDRTVETYGIAVSKQVCDKPVADTVWPFEEVADHWDRLELHSRLTVGDAAPVVYQEGAVAGLLAPPDLIARLTGGPTLPDGTAMMGGTLPAIGGVRPGRRFEASLIDPVLNRRIDLAYAIETLPIAG